jgi:hypothetical protein
MSGLSFGIIRQQVGRIFQSLAVWTTCDESSPLQKRYPQMDGGSQGLGESSGTSLSSTGIGFAVAGGILIIMGLLMLLARAAHLSNSRKNEPVTRDERLTYDDWLQLSADGRPHAGTPVTLLNPPSSRLQESRRERELRREQEQRGSEPPPRYDQVVKPPPSYRREEATVEVNHWDRAIADIR